MERLVTKFGRKTSLMALASLLLAAGLFHIPTASGAQLQQRSITLADSTTSAVTEYTVEFELLTPGSLGSTKVMFCANSPLPEDPCYAPVDFDASQASLQPIDSGVGSSIVPASGTANEIVIAHAPALGAQAQVKYVLSTIKNPSYEGSFFARLYTYPTADASGPESDFGGLALSTGSSVTVRTEVPPYISFCVGNVIAGTDCSTAQGNFVDLGVLSPSRASSGNIAMLAATNAENGYTVRANGNTLTAGSQVIPALAAPTQSAPGTSQFGINLRQNSNPDSGAEPAGPGRGTGFGDYAIPNRYTYRSGDIIAASSTADDYRRYTINYIVNVSNQTPAGVYNSTFTYLALANF